MLASLLAGINWHEAAVCAIQITLRDYAHLLEYLTEYPLGNNAYRIDLLVIRKLLDAEIPHSIARIFRSHNLFEIKGIHSSVTVISYYKTTGYATLLIAADLKSPSYKRQDISLLFLSWRYPKKLIRHLTEECKIEIANPSPGIYYINNDIYPVQIIVPEKLPPEETLYLRCLTDRLTDRALIERLAADYFRHQEQAMHVKYMNQLTHANISKEYPLCIAKAFSKCTAPALRKSLKKQQGRHMKKTLPFSQKLRQGLLRSLMKLQQCSLTSLMKLPQNLSVSRPCWIHITSPINSICCYAHKQLLYIFNI